MPIKESQASFANTAISPPPPDNVTILLTNLDASNTVNISLPETGNLWVGYEISGSGGNAPTVEIWHQGGTTTPVPLGFNTFPVNATDELVYTLAAPDQVIKLGWGYE